MGLFGNKTLSAGYKWNDAEFQYLEILRREIANLIVDADPDLMICTYERAWEFEREITAIRERAVAEEAALVAKFQMLTDFDTLGTRHFVPYAEARDMLSDDQLVERYLEIGRMLVFMRRRQASSAYGPVHDAKDADVLDKCMRREKDRRLRTRIEDAIRRFGSYSAGLQKGDPTASLGMGFEDAEVQVVYLPSLSEEHQYGVIFKRTNEFGVYGFYVTDSGDIFYHYYRSDLFFKEQHRLSN